LYWYFGFFVVSGFCGLVYEVIWLRLAMASFGVTTALASIVISMFMAGLGLGSWGAGLLTRRFLAGNGPKALRVYCIAELLVGISSIAVPMQLKAGRLFVQHLGSFGTWQSSQYYVLAGAWIALTIVPWCTCMGSTFPLLMAVIRQTGQQTSERSFSYLYVANVVGALLGTLVSAFILIELLGFQGTLNVAGSLNACLALCAFALSIRGVFAPSIEKPNAERLATRNLYGLPKSAILLFLFTTGLVSMGMEVVWIRQFTPYLGNVVYAFAGIIAVYLMATVTGSLDYRSNARAKRPVSAAGSWSLLALFAAIPVVAADPSLSLGNMESGVFCLASIMLFCATAGFLTPMLVDSWSAGDPDRAGKAYAINIAGSIVGPLIVGFWLLPWLGERKSLLALSLPLFAIAAVTAFKKSPAQLTDQKAPNPRILFCVTTIIAILFLSFTHDYETRFADRRVRRDYTATVIAAGKGFDRELLVNGSGMTLLNPITKYIAHLPLASLSHPPKNGLVICFGMGTSFRSMLTWGIPTTAVDLVPSVPAMFSYYHDDADKVRSSPLAKIVVDDGRRFLDGSNETYDVIVTDPPPPTSAPGSSLLYSRDFYEVIKKHLIKGGILQTWYPASQGDDATAASVAKALSQSFPYVRAFGSYEDKFGIHFLASMEPLPAISSSELAARMPAAAASDLVEWGPEPSAQKQFDLVLAHERSMSALIAKDPQVPAMQDDKPVNEYFLLRDWFRYYK
jgi:predicted membrane-bound spermidine synthase